ncbi:MAG: hypothetical protein KKE50_04540, partial [Nanoarchaeota archaeon]|nr:hypothetical protein [Nanoarchaeota archaeon]
MGRRGRKVVVVFLVAFIFLNLCLLVILVWPEVSSITGRFIGLGDFIIKSMTSISRVMITLPGGLGISIDSPQNITYNFSIGDVYTLGLNVSADFNATLWRYTLTDLRHNSVVYNNVAFTPNTTFDAVRWSNFLSVYADDTGSGRTAGRNVTFFVYVPNSAPYITIPSQIYICEDSALHYYFNVSDNDEDVSSPDFTVDNNPKDVFHVALSSVINDTTRRWELFSTRLTKQFVGNHSQIIEASDGQYSDSKNANISVIEINHAPVAENIGARTVWTRGENSTFYKQVGVSDAEDGSQSSGNLTFNLTFISSVNLFNITSTGVINFTANESQTGVYNLSLCVRDRGLQNVHPNISLCGQDGSFIEVCQNFSVTVTNENRNPTIISYYPLNPALVADGTDILYFNLTKYDADGTIPDSYWYVDGSFEEYDSGSSFDEFRYSFGCGISGVHTVKAEITDGLLNDSIEWSINVTRVSCPAALPGGGGGGGWGGCTEKWACGNWNVCQNAEKSRVFGLLAGGDYRDIKERCKNNYWVDEVCGFQTRNCFDASSCNRTLNRPSLVQECYYSESPSCKDGVKNCHDNSCELLVDCGGPCSSCPTCSDGIMNQDEGGIDCGGPCPWKCKV